MIIESKQINVPLAIGLRWLVATHAEIEQLKERTELTYGFVLSLADRNQRKYKQVALASDEHENAMSLAALLAIKYKNLIFINKLGHDFYWLCVIKNNEVWNEIDIGSTTIGDLLGNREKINASLQLAIQDFTESSIPHESCTFSSGMDDDEFKEITATKFSDIVAGIRKNNKYKIKQIESHRKKVRQIIMTTVLVMAGGVIGYYVYETQNETARALAAKQEAERAAAQAIYERNNYFRGIIVKLDINSGPKVINRFLSLAEQLPLQSQGWQVTTIDYNAMIPQQLNITLKRGIYGDVLSFKHAYKNRAVQQKINDDANSGSMTLNFDGAPMTVPVTLADIQKYTPVLMGTDSMQRSALISYTQRHSSPLKIDPPQQLNYGVKSSHVSIVGTRLWDLRKLQYLFKQFPTLIVDSISLSVSDDREISWKVEGQIYG